MGRKAKASKPTSVAKSPPQLPTVSGEIPANISSDPPLSEISPSARKRKYVATVRRSQRFMSTPGNQDMEIIQEINISETEKDDEPPTNEQENMSPVETSEETEKNSPKGHPGLAFYKSMYISSQKKIKSLMKENRELNKSLEHALGKVDVFEKQSHLYSDVINVMASLAKVNENLSAQFASCENTEGGGRSSKRNNSP